MNYYNYFAIVISLSVLLGYINNRYIKMQTTVAIMTGSLLISLLVIWLGEFHIIEIKPFAIDIVKEFDFEKILMEWMLGYLLFAGSVQLDINSLQKQFSSIILLATMSTIISTFLVGCGSYYLMQFLNINIGFNFCLLFGALISPTDPIAVLGVLKNLNASEDISIKMAGESLFNDGVGIVIFTVILGMIYTNQPITLSSVSLLFTVKALGGSLFGAILGLGMFYFIKHVDDSKLMVLITLAGVTAGYALAEMLNISGPLSMVIAGLFIGNKGKKFSMLQKTCYNLDMFWEIIDEILNAMLFLMMGFEILIIDYSHINLILICLIIPLVLVIRYITVVIPIAILRFFKEQPNNITAILSWGGLRGGLAVALALSLPDSEEKNIILAMTYMIVIFSILVQSTTIRFLVKQK